MSTPNKPSAALRRTSSNESNHHRPYTPVTPIANLASLKHANSTSSPLPSSPEENKENWDPGHQRSNGYILKRRTRSYARLRNGAILKLYAAAVSDDELLQPTKKGRVEKRAVSDPELTLWEEQEEEQNSSAAESDWELSDSSENDSDKDQEDDEGVESDSENYMRPTHPLTNAQTRQTRLTPRALRARPRFSFQFPSSRPEGSNAISKSCSSSSTGDSISAYYSIPPVPTPKGVPVTVPPPVPLVRGVLVPARSCRSMR